MSKYDEMMSMLKLIYNETCAKNIPVYSKTSDELGKDIEAKLDIYRLLTEDGYLIEESKCIGTPISCRLTAKGIRTIEGVSNTQAGSLTINAEKIINTGILANSATGNTVNISNAISYKEIADIVEKMNIPNTEKEDIIKALEPLYKCIENGSPLQKGILSRLRNNLAKYQTLYAVVAQSIMNYFVNIKQ